MANPKQILKIDPNTQLMFRGPFNVPVVTHLKLENPSDSKVLYKIRTTMPKQFAVRPKSGILDAKTSVDLDIYLIPFMYKPAEKTRYKFMVQSLIAPNEDIDIDEFLKASKPDEIMETKLKCLFKEPVEDPVTDTQKETVEDCSKEDKDISAQPEVELQSIEFNQEPEAVSEEPPQEEIKEQQPTEYTDAQQEVSTDLEEPQITETPLETITTVVRDPNFDKQLQNVIEEVQQLRERSRLLTLENLFLKEEFMRSRLEAELNMVKPSRCLLSVTQLQQLVSTIYVYIIVLLGFVGIIMGKIFLDSFH